MNAARRRVRWLWGRLDRLLSPLDAEKVTGHQTVYYVLMATAGLYLWLGARNPTATLEDTLGPTFYNAWLILNIACPLVSLYGRRLITVASRIRPDEPNPALAGAWLQLAGDGGAWGAVIVYIACIFNTTYWGQAIYPSFFVLMGVPAGFMFTVRSWRRISQINRLAKRLPK